MPPLAIAFLGAAFLAGAAFFEGAAFFTGSFAAVTDLDISPKVLVGLTAAFLTAAFLTGSFFSSAAAGFRAESNAGGFC